MARAIWSGSISFGLVNIPVKLYPAVHDHGVHFHMLHEKDGVRIHQSLVCPADGETLTLGEIVNGYEISPERYIVVSDEEIESLAPKASRLIEILDFVDLSEIDPVYYQRTYYLLPDEQGVRAYGLLIGAMNEAGKVGIGKFVMRGKEYLGALRPLDRVLCLETMHFADEVVPADSIEELPGEPEAKERELRMARQLIEELSTSFEPERYHDEHRDSLMELIQAKAEGQEFVMPEPVGEPAQVIDLMSALEESVARAKKKGGKRQRSTG
jgi:DNA end-binding protein Ku